jgi:hypothetical protein
MSAGFSIANIRAYGKSDPVIRGFEKRALVCSYSEFVDALYDDIFDAVSYISLSPQHLLKESEDATTHRLMCVLHGKGYRCAQANAGGNIDISVENIALSFRWIGEAKKFESLANLREGYLQLATRYIPGSDETGIGYGGLIAYLRRPNAAKLMRDWRAEFEKMEVAQDCSIQSCTRLSSLAFNSEHRHESSGLPFRVWHLCVQLFHAPKDKSARASARYGGDKMARTQAK